LAQAALEQARASVEMAQLNYDWTDVKAPLAGRVSRRRVDPGNLVTADGTVLTTLVTENPAYVYFDVDERTYTNQVKPSAASSGAWSFGVNYPILMRLAAEEEFERVGRVDFIDNQVSGNTGTIQLRGIFDSDGDRLKPGMFARVRLPLGKRYKALLVADEAIQNDQGRKYVYVLDSKNEVVYRPVTLGHAVGTLRVLRDAVVENGVVKEGVVAGDRVLISGAQQVRPGMHVEVIQDPPPARPDSPLGRLLAAKQTAKDDKVTR
jgi:RND family efflux transporter MFP subunit